MDRGEAFEILLTAIIIFSLAAPFVLAQMNTVVSWDEAVYLSLARHLSQGKGYDNPYIAVDSTRSPLFPSTVAAINYAFGESEVLARLISPLFGVVAFLALYRLSGEFGLDRRERLVACAFLSANSFFLLLSTRIMTDTLFIALSILAVMFIHKALKDLRLSLVASLLVGLCFLTRYTGMIFVALVVLIVLAKRQTLRLLKGKYLWLSLALFLAVLSPWFIIGETYFGDPIGALRYGQPAPIGSTFWLMSLPQTVYYLPALLIISLTALPLVAYGAVAMIRRRRDYGLVIFLWVALLLLFYLVTRPEATFIDRVRYLAPALPPLSIVAGIGYSEARKSTKRQRLTLLSCLVVAAVLINLVGELWLANSYQNYEKHRNLKLASEFVGENAPVGSTVMSDLWPFISYYSDRPCIQFPSDAKNFIKSLNERRVSYVMVSVYYQYPSYVGDLLSNRSLLAKDFSIRSDSEDLISVYRYLGFKP